MLTVASPDALELKTNATFEALMWALSRPGDSRDLPESGLRAIIETLIDLECTVFADDPALRGQIAATGALVVEDVSQADHVFLSRIESSDGRLARLRCGSALYPDDGATVVGVVARGRGERLRLTGPGIDGAVEVTLELSPAFWALRAKLCAYPEGFDLLLVDGRSVIGIPRSTLVEVL